MEFEWDEDKNELNKQKHGLSFETAKFVFNDPMKLDIFDEIHSTFEEDRWNVIGKINDVLFVVYTERGDKTRLISARLATPKEKEFYYGNCLSNFKSK